MDEEERSGYVFRGNVQTGAVGTGASATVGALFYLLTRLF